MQFSQQDIEKIKEKSCVAFLASRGYKPKSTRGRTYKYIRPWGGESVPSVHVYLESNTFVDFGNKEISGSVIQLCMATESVDFYKACEILMGNELPSKKIEEFAVRESPIKIKMVKSIESPWLIQYLSKRNIPLSIAQAYCKQVYCEIHMEDGKVYKKSCIGFKSDKGAYELRNPKTKISNSPKYFTTIQQGHKDLYLLEGAFDFLSLVACGKLTDATYIVLNSIVNMSYVDFSVYETVHYLCDNDAVGNQWFDKIQHNNKIDERTWFYPYKDINEWWIAKKDTSGSLYQKELIKLL